MNAELFRGRKQMDFYVNKALLSCGFIVLNGSLNRWIIMDKRDVLECLIPVLAAIMHSQKLKIGNPNHNLSFPLL